MPNTIGFQDWLKILDKEYLSSFIKDGRFFNKVCCNPRRTEGTLILGDAQPLSKVKLHVRGVGRCNDTSTYAPGHLL